MSVRIPVEESLTQDSLPVIFNSEIEDAITTQCNGTVGIVLKYKQTFFSLGGEMAEDVLSLFPTTLTHPSAQHLTEKFQPPIVKISQSSKRQKTGFLNKKKIFY